LIILNKFTILSTRSLEILRALCLMWLNAVNELAAPSGIKRKLTWQPPDSNYKSFIITYKSWKVQQALRHKASSFITPMLWHLKVKFMSSRAVKTTRVVKGGSLSFFVRVPAWSSKNSIDQAPQVSLFACLIANYHDPLVESIG
jgi:hypothetical protein